MVLNNSIIKTEALLLYCRDLILSYKSNKDNLFIIDKEVKDFINQEIDNILKNINLLVQPIDYYIRNSIVSRIKIIIKSYNYIDKSISNSLKKGDIFDPAMLCFSLLCSWFAELQITNKNKEFIFFSLYPYSKIYDVLLLNKISPDLKTVNIKMIDLSEDVILKLHKYKFK